MITATMITMDRSPDRNYLQQTLLNLIRSGLKTSDRLKSLIISDTGPDTEWAARILRDLDLRDVLLIAPMERVCANTNVVRALRRAVEENTEWILFLEDDIDVCADFFGSVGKWLDDVARGDRHVYALGAAYPQVDTAWKDGYLAWEYPVSKFYGTQAIVVRRRIAMSIADYIESHLYDRESDGTAYDILIQDWSRATYPDIGHFLASCPSMVQHVATQSAIRPRSNIHRFETWPGRNWSYWKVKQALRKEMIV